MRILVWFLLSWPAFATTEFQSPAAFTTRRCEEYLLGPETRAKTDDALTWLQNLKPMTLSVMKWHVNEGETPGPDMTSPRAIFFDEVPPGTTLESIMRRYQDAKREADRQSQSAVPTVLASNDAGPSTTLDFDELAALGFPTDDEVSLAALTARMRSEHGALVFDVENGEGAKTTFHLRFQPLLPGFDNAVAAWQATTIDSHTDPPVRAFDGDAAAAELMRKFFGAHGRFVLTRRAAGKTYAYAFDRRVLKSNPDRHSHFDLTIYRIAECDRQTMVDNTSIVIPRRHNQKYACLIPLGLRLTVPTQLTDPWFMGPGASNLQAY